MFVRRVRWHARGEHTGWWPLATGCCAAGRRAFYLVPRFQPDKFSFLSSALGRTRLPRQRTVKDDFFEPFRCFKSLPRGEERRGEERSGSRAPKPAVEILPISFIIISVPIFIQAYSIIYAPPVVWILIHKTTFRNFEDFKENLVRNKVD